MSMHRIVLRDERGVVIGLEFVTSAAARDAKLKEHAAKGRKAEAAAGTMDGFNFVEG